MGRKVDNYVGRKVGRKVDSQTGRKDRCEGTCLVIHVLPDPRLS